MGERRGPSRVAGPSDAGAAMTMGNSLEMWDKVYDENFKAREVQAAVDAMDQWRAGLVGKMGDGAREPELLAQGTLHEVGVGLTSLAEEFMECSEGSQDQSQDSHESEPEYEDSEESASESHESQESEPEYEDSQGEEEVEESLEIEYDDASKEGVDVEGEEEEWEDDDVVVDL